MAKSKRGNQSSKKHSGKKSSKSSKPRANSLQSELYRMQRELYLKNKDIIDHSVVITDSNFEKYRRRYERTVAKFSEISSKEEMMKEIMKADVVFVGDYHTCNQSQRSFLRILKDVVKKNKKIMIGMELIHINNQKYLDEFLRGKLGEELFLKKIGFHQDWIFDLWPNFKPIFDFVKYHRIPVYALDASGIDAPLLKRDKTSAKIITDIIKKNPDSKLFVFIGDLHLAPEHLPREVDRLLRSPKSDSPKSDYLTTRLSDYQTIILYQNSEAIYWELAQKGLADEVEVVKVDENSFCRMHTPPVISQQSYINWLEHEEGEIDYADAKQSFLELVERISGLLKIKLGKEKDDIEVYTSGDLSFLKKLKRKKNFSKEEYEIVKQQILHSESYYIATQKIVYLANLSINHAAEEASHFIKTLCSGPEFPRDLVDAFYANTLHEALGFFGSKLINSKRKCLHENEFKDLYKYLNKISIPSERELEYETSKIVLEYLKHEKKGRPLTYEAIFSQGPELFMSTTHSLGYMLGDQMYYALKSDVLSKKEVKEMFFDPWEEEGEPFETYISLKNRIKRVKVPRRM